MSFRRKARVLRVNEKWLVAITTVLSSSGRSAEFMQVSSYYPTHAEALNYALRAVGLEPKETER